MTSLVVASVDEARGLTAQIRMAGMEFGELLREAHDKQVWKALEYKTWNEYVDAEFDFGKRYANYVLKAGDTRKQLEAGTGVPGIKITEGTARTIGNRVP